MDSRVLAALATVNDPCSVAVGAPLSLVDMGLVIGWAFDEAGCLVVRFDSTGPACMMATHFMEEAETRLRDIPGVRSVDVRCEPSGEWTPERLTARGQGILDHRRRTAELRITGPVRRESSPAGPRTRG